MSKEFIEEYNVKFFTIDFYENFREHLNDYSQSMCSLNSLDDILISLSCKV